MFPQRICLLSRRGGNATIDPPAQFAVRTAERPGEVAPLTLAAVGAYFPLYQLQETETILSREWPVTVAGLVRQQLREPLEEIHDRPAIPSLTPIDDGVSMQVMQQYEENPYPRWIIDPHTALSPRRPRNK